MFLLFLRSILSLNARFFLTFLSPYFLYVSFLSCYFVQLRIAKVKRLHKPWTSSTYEPKYGLSVTGFVHPDKIYKNYGCQPGDVLVLTKQLGSGIVNTTVKAQMASEAAADEAAKVMASLNQRAKRAIEKHTIHACTDVTGFGLLGHCTEMAEASDMTLELYPEQIEYMTEAIAYARMGLVPAGAYKNREFAAEGLDAGDVEEVYLDLISDPQTSGGLLVSVPREELDCLLADFEAVGMETKVSVVGCVKERQEKLIQLKKGKMEML